MKRLSRLLMMVCVILAFTIAQVSPAKASSSVQVPASTPAEEYVKEALLNTGVANLATKFPNPINRVVSGTFISGLFTDPTLQARPFIKIYNVTVDGDIAAEGITIPFNVELHNSTFYGGINLENAEVKTFRIDDSSVYGSVRLGHMVVKGDLALYQSTFTGEVTLFGTVIDNNLFARGSVFLGTVPDSFSAYPFELWTTQVGQVTEFTNAIIKGEAKVDDAKFGVDVKFDGAIFEKPASFMNITVGNVANFQKVVFKDTVTFESSIVERDAEFTGASFGGVANFDYLSVTRFFDFNQIIVAKKFSFIYPTIGWPYFVGTTFKGPVDFEGMQASNDFDFTNATYSYSGEPFTVTLAKVDGVVKFDGFAAPAGLSLERNQFGNLIISAKDKPKFAFIDLDSTKVDGDLTVENINTDEFSAQGFIAKDSTTFQQISVSKKLDFSNANLGVFTLDKEFWPKNPTAFNLRGMTYADIGLFNKELNDGTWKILLNMVQQSSYSPQAYRTLSQFLTEKGQPDWAADVEFQRKQRERNSILTPLTGPWFWSWFLDIFSGYGQRPQYAFGWSLLVIAIGAIVFRREDDMVILDQSEAKPAYHPILYSFALFLPYIDLDVASKWEPKPQRKAASLYKHIHRLLGWILMPIALLTFGGIIK